MKKRNILFILILFILIGSYLYTSNIQRYLSPLSAYGDSLSNEYEYFSISAFPNGMDGACLITLDDISYATQTQHLGLVENLLVKYGAYATFFVIPRHGGGEERALGVNHDILDLLSACVERGDEVALHGYTHFPTEELKGKSREEQKEIISKGKAELEAYFGHINGFRPPSFWKNTDTYNILEELGFDYCASASIFNVYPYHPKDFFHPLFGDDIDIIEVPCFPEDYFWNLSSDNSVQQYFQLVTRFESCHKKGTTYVFFSHLDKMVATDEDTGKKEGLEVFERFLAYTKEANIWMPNVKTYVNWFCLLEDLNVNNIISKNKLIIDIATDKDTIEGLTLNMRLPQGVDAVIVYLNDKLIYERMNCQPNDVIIL